MVRTWTLATKAHHSEHYRHSEFVRIAGVKFSHPIKSFTCYSLITLSTLKCISFGSTMSWLPSSSIGLLTPPTRSRLFNVNGNWSSTRVTTASVNLVHGRSHGFALTPAFRLIKFYSLLADPQRTYPANVLTQAHGKARRHPPLGSDRLWLVSGSISQFRLFFSLSR
jgi:hypothetical protein